MTRRVITAISALTLMLACITQFHLNRTVQAHVADIVVPDQYSTIQAAIDHANDGDTVFVKAGMYYEHITINKRVAIVGENVNTTIIDGSRTGIVVSITQNGVNVSSFTIQRSGTAWNIGGPPYAAGIFMTNLAHCNLFGNRISQNGIGIQLEYGADNNSITNNTITDNDVGLGTFDASWNTFVGNTVTGNSRGLGLNVNSDYNIISNNFITASEWTIAMHACHYNNLTRNYIGNGQVGVFFPDSSYNRIYHNSIVNNGQQASAAFGGLSPLLNYWDDGYPSGGNYWGDYSGIDSNSGPYQNETGSDGIGDASYVVDENNTDHYPLMHPWNLGFLYSDLNKDGTVNILDVFLVAKAFGSKPEDENWNAVADLNNDNIINILDIFAVARDYGKTVQSFTTLA